MRASVRPSVSPVPVHSPGAEVPRTGSGVVTVGGETRFRSGPGELGAGAGRGAAGGERVPGPQAGPSRAAGAGPREEAPPEGSPISPPERRAAF